MLHTHLYGFHVIYPCIIAHEPPYQTYSSVGQAGFRRRFPRTNDHTGFHVSVGLAPIRFIISNSELSLSTIWARIWVTSQNAQKCNVN